MAGQKQKTNFIDPPNVLREKVGYGGIDPLMIARAEDFIDSNEVDFASYALVVMGRLNDILTEAKAGKIEGREAVDLMTQPIMELKANGGMFRYMLVTEIAGIVLNFLENIDDFNDDVYGVIEAHQNTLSAIIANKLQGSGGKEGQALARELYAACQRYYKKYEVKLRG